LLSWLHLRSIHKQIKRLKHVSWRLVSASHVSCVVLDWDGLGEHDRVHRQLSVSSDSKLLDEDIREEARVILRPKKPPRPKSEVFLNKEQQRRTKRYSAFGVSCLNGPQEKGNLFCTVTFQVLTAASMKMAVFLG
jgi:hypothetical protein